MPGVSARNKGAGGEREIADRFRDLMRQVEAEPAFADPNDRVRFASEHVKRNTLQSDRGGFDLVGIPLIAPEVKRCETLNLPAWWTQCVAQAAKQHLMPVLLYRRSRRPWMARTHVLLAGLPGNSHWLTADYPADEFFVWYVHVYRHYLLHGISV